jgi:diacylglycerol kinase (ATP)
MLYNPLSGSRHHRRLAEVKAAAAVLRGAGIEVTVAPTHSSAATARQVSEAIAQGCDAVFACGGDGTAHDVMQALVGTKIALGLIPLGTANALAHDLGIPLKPVSAARAALSAVPRRVATGHVRYSDFSGNPGSRYFTVTLGIGSDAHLFKELDPALKIRFGMLAYYAKATWLWLTLTMRSFAVEFQQEGLTRQANASDLLAVRIAYFGGVLRELAPGASLDRNDFRLVLFQTHSRIRYLHYILRGIVGARWKVPGIELAHSAAFFCRPVPGEDPVFVEADGEILGTLPAEAAIIPDALTVLAPAR